VVVRLVCRMVFLVLGILPSLASGAIVQSNLTSSASETNFPCSAGDLIDGSQSLVTNESFSPTPQYGLPAALTNGGLGRLRTAWTHP
jgi:hypothetical protein